MHPAGFYCTQVNKDLLCYSTSITFPLLHSFSASLSPATWREHFDPFACVVIDQKTHEMALIRDHLGIHPLYYSYQAGKLIFAETIPEILQQLPQVPALAETEIVNMLSDVNFYSDETIYQGIYRVEPGYIIYIQSNGRIQKTAFWSLARTGEALNYKDDRQYLEHFSSLMQEAVQVATRGHTRIAAEFSAGIDSSAVYCTAVAQGLKPALFMHDALPDTQAKQLYNNQYEQAFLAHYDIHNLQRITHEDCDLLSIFEEYAKWYAGPAPHIFYMFAHNIHRAVAREGYPILLSGFGGDQGVSGHIPNRFILPALCKQKKYRAAWRALSEGQTTTANPIIWLRRLTQFVKFMHPMSHAVILSLENVERRLRNIGKAGPEKKGLFKNPFYTHYYENLRAAEWNFLQGPLSHEIRMRIEYSSVASKKMGFEYRYPLLYPKLLEFFLRVPVEQKRRHGIGRYLMRRYVGQHVPPEIFNQYHKKEGLAIVPATMALFKKNYAQGLYQEAFKDLPYQELTQHTLEHLMMVKQVCAYMLKVYMP